MKCIIPAAGFGTRLKEISANTPKTLLKIKGKTILDHILENLTETPNITEILIISNSKFYDQFSRWKSQSNYSIPITVINDGVTESEKILGGVKDIRLGVDMNSDEDYLVILSDNLFNFSLKDVYNQFKEKNKDIVVVVDLKSLEKIKRFGCVEIDENKNLTNFVEKPENPKSTLAATGVYFYKNASIKLIDTYLEQGNNPRGPGFFVQWLYTKKPVFCYVVEENQWYDIGSIEIFNKLNEQ